MRGSLYALIMWFSGVCLLRSLYSIYRHRGVINRMNWHHSQAITLSGFRLKQREVIALCISTWSATPPYNPRAGRFVHRARMWAYLSLTPRRFKWWQSARPAYKTLQNDETPNNVKYNTSDNDLRHLVTMIKIIDDLRLTITLAIILLYYKCIENYGRPYSSTLWISNKLQTFTGS